MVVIEFTRSKHELNYLKKILENEYIYTYEKVLLRFKISLQSWTIEIDFNDQKFNATIFNQFQYYDLGSLSKEQIFEIISLIQNEPESVKKFFKKKLNYSEKKYFEVYPEYSIRENDSSQISNKPLSISISTKGELSSDEEDIEISETTQEWFNIINDVDENNQASIDHFVKTIDTFFIDRKDTLNSDFQTLSDILCNLDDFLEVLYSLEKTKFYQKYIEKFIALINKGDFSDVDKDSLIDELNSQIEMSSFSDN